MIYVNTSQYYKLAIQYSSLAFLYYDYTLTFRQEVKYLWCKPFRLSGLMYFLCRYAMLANLLYLLAITDILHEVRPKLASCNVWYQVISAISIFGRIGIMTIMTIRTYVVWGRNTIILVIFGLLELTCIVLSCIKVPASICRGAISGTSLQVSAALSILVLLFDLSATVLTLLRAHLALAKWRRNGVGYKNTILYFIWEQGILYFLAVFGLQLAAIIVPAVASGGFFQRMLAAYTLPLSGLLSARFLLHLQAWGDTQQKHQEGSSYFSSCNLSFVAAPDQPEQAGFITEFGSDPVYWTPVRVPERVP